MSLSSDVQEKTNKISSLINHKLHLSYTYVSMSQHFDRADIALNGFSQFFAALAKKVEGDVHQLLTYQNKRGWRIAYKSIKAPAVYWDTPLSTLTDALKFEKEGCRQLLAAELMGDAHLSDFLDKFISKKVDLVKKLGSLSCELKRCGEGVGIYQFDSLTMNKMKDEL